MSGGHLSLLPWFSPLKAIWDSILKRRKRQTKYFECKWIFARNLKPDDLLKGRPYKQYYPRTEDSLLKDLILHKKNVLVRGSPLAGKTRTVFEVLKSMDLSCDVIIPRSEDIDVEDYPFPISSGPNLKVVILDDLDRFVKIKNFERLFKIIRDKNFIIVATCQTGNPFKLVESIVVEKKIELETIFGKNIIDVSDITEDEARKISNQENIEWKDTEFDGTIGSIFLKLGEMRNRYNALDLTEKDLLKTIKKLHISGIYEGNHIFPYEWIETAFKANYPDTKFHWDHILSPLKNSELVSLPEQKKVHVEEVYLEKIVEFHNPQSELTILKEMLNIFSGNYIVLLKIGNKSLQDSQIGEQHVEFMNISREASEEALKDTKLDPFSKQYATIQFDRGVAYMVLALVEKSEADFINAINAFKEALKVFEYNKLSIDFANTQQNLGNAYLCLSLFADEYENLLKAEIALKGALEIFKRHNMTNDCASVLLNLGTVSQRLANLQVQLQED